MSSAWLPRHVLPAPDPLPQPFRMLDKLVSGIVERALDAAEEREGGRHDGAQLPVQEPAQTVTLDLDADATAVAFLAPGALCIGTAQGGVQLYTVTGSALHASASCSIGGGRVTALQAALVPETGSGVVAAVTHSTSGACALSVVPVSHLSRALSVDGAVSLGAACEPCSLSEGLRASSIHIAPNLQHIAIVGSDGRVAVASVRLDRDAACTPDDATQLRSKQEDSNARVALPSAHGEAAPPAEPARPRVQMLTESPAAAYTRRVADEVASVTKQHVCLHWQLDATHADTRQPEPAAARAAVFHVAGARELFLLPLPKDHASLQPQPVNRSCAAVQLLRCPSAIACSAMCADGCTLLLGLQGACFLAYDTSRRFIKTLSHLAPSSPVCMHVLGSGRRGHVFAVGEDGSVLLWEPHEAHVSARPSGRLRGAAALELATAAGALLLRGPDGWLLWHDGDQGASRRLRLPPRAGLDYAACAHAPGTVTVASVLARDHLDAQSGAAAAGTSPEVTTEADTASQVGTTADASGNGGLAQAHKSVCIATYDMASLGTTNVSGG